MVNFCDNFFDDCEIVLFRYCRKNSEMFNRVKSRGVLGV